MAELLNDKIRKSYDIIAQAIELQFEYSDNKEVDPYVNLVEDLCDIEQIVINHTSIMHKLEANDSEPMSLHIAKFYDAEMNKTKSNSRNNIMYKNFNSLITNITSNDKRNDTGVDMEDEMAIVDSVSYIDPITKNRLVNPVRNIICKHVYEKRSLEESILINPRMRCPVVGCPNKQFVALKDVREDFELKKKISQLNNQDSD